MSRYQLQEGGGVYDRDHNRSIPPSMSNRHWRGYKASGEVADPIPPVDPKDAIRAELATTDRGMPRGLEDIVATLVRLQVMTRADLPIETQTRIQRREDLRAQLRA